MIQNLIRLMHKLPYFKGKESLLLMAQKWVRFAPSFYGPLMLSRSVDFTNRACYLGYYGDELAKIIRTMPRDGIFLDFGANQGLYSLLAAQHLSAGKVYSFETNSSVFSDLVANINENGLKNVVPFNFGVAAKTDLVGMVVEEGHTGGGRIEQSGEPTALLVDIDAVYQRLPVDAAKTVVCKIDTEGSEFIILNMLSASGMLDGITTAFVEIDDKNLAQMDCTAAQIYELMKKNGFSTRYKLGHSEHYDEVWSR